MSTDPDSQSEQPTEPRATPPEPGESGAMFEQRPPEAPMPERIGQYRILHKLGSGGMGSVYAALQETEGLKLRVAIKLVRRGVDTEDVLRRFALERHVLGSLDHPNIARFYNAGETDDGRPYFVMEYVEGQRIDDYCDANNLAIRQRLELFQKVCAAVHHAHTNLIVHRDLKPSNIIVTPKGEPKLLDFGIAKLLNPDLAKVTVVTGPSVRLMTPEYASPEQVRGAPVNTLSDVYSLGVLLYELLTGRRPYHLKSRLEQEIIRIICDTDPDRPSTALARIERVPSAVDDGSTQTLEDIAKHRDTRPEGLRRQLSGELDDIIMMALSKAPLLRYPSAQTFSEDVQNYLVGQAVLARNTRRRTLYLVRKFVRRHPAVVSATAASFLALATGGSIALWQRMEAEAARKVAVQQTAVAVEQRQIATGFANDLWDISNDFIDDFHQAVVMLPGSLSARQLLISKGSSYLEKLAGTVSDDNKRLFDLANSYELLGAVQSDLRSGSTGDIDAAIGFQRKALDLRQRLLQTQIDNRAYIEAAATSHIRLGDLQTQLGNRPEARKAYETARDLLQPIDGDTRKEIRIRAKLYSSLDRLALLHQMSGEYDQALSLSERANALRRDGLRLAQSAGIRRNVSIGQNNLGELYIDMGRVDEALSLFQRAVDTQRDIVAKNPDASRYRRNLTISLSSLAGGYLAAGRPDDALASANEAREIIQNLLGQESDITQIKDVRHLKAMAIAQLHVTDALVALHEYEQAQQAADMALETCEALAALSPDNASFRDLLRDALSANGAALTRLGRPGQALELLKQARTISDTRSAADPTLVPAQRALAIDHKRIGDALLLLADDPDTTPARASTAAQQALDAYRLAASIRIPLQAAGTLDPLTKAQLADLDERIDDAQRRAIKGDAH